MLDGLLQSRDGKLKCVYVYGHPETLCGHLGKVIKRNKLPVTHDNIMNTYKMIKNVPFLNIKKVTLTCKMLDAEIKEVYVRLNKGKE